MMTETTVESNELRDPQGPGLTGVKLYSPATVAAYSVVGGLPLGCLLYGLNSARRGSRGIATILYVLAAANCLIMTAAAGLGASIRGYGLLGIFGAIGFYNLESGPFRRALLKGATRARWWPPALIVIAIYVLAAVAQVALSGRGAE